MKRSVVHRINPEQLVRIAKFIRQLDLLECDPIRNVIPHYAPKHYTVTAEYVHRYKTGYGTKVNRTVYKFSIVIPVQDIESYYIELNDLRDQSASVKKSGAYDHMQKLVNQAFLESRHIVV